MNIFKRVQKKEIDSILKLFLNVKKKLLKQGIFQWKESLNDYPGKKEIDEAFNRNELFVLEIDSKIVGSVIMNQNTAPEWNNILWINQNNPFLVLHALMISPENQGMGMGSKMIKHCLTFAKVNNYQSIRLDCFSKNISSIKLYEKNGFQNLGKVFFPFKSKGNEEYFCYEREI